MDLSLITDKVVNFTKDLTDKILKELSSYMEKNKLTDDTKVQLQDDIREIIKSYGEIYEVKDRGVYIYSKSSEYPEFDRNLYQGQRDGYYILENNNLIYDENINRDINQKINLKREELIRKQNDFLDSCRIAGEEYLVDELGDDEKNIYLTRKSDELEFQDFEISDTVYNSIKENNEKGKATIIIWNGEEYYMK